MTATSRLEGVRLLVVGAGGHARVVLDAAMRGGATILGLVDSRPDLRGERIGGHPVLGGDDAVDGFDPATVLLVDGIGVRPRRGDPGTRLRVEIEAGFRSRGWRFATVVDPSATIAGEVTIEPGSQVMAGVVVQPRCRIGGGAVLNTRSSIDHDCHIGAHAFVSPGAVLCGGVTVGARAFIGAGAVVLPGTTIGEGAIVQAGAVIAGTIAAGGFAAR